MHTEPERDIACLLVHGLNGSPYDFDDVAAQLGALGYPTQQLLLPGHDVLARIAVRYGWNDWTAAIHESFNALAQRHRRVVVIGHSMGGTLGLHVAACDDRVAGIAALCAPVALHAGLRPIVRMGKAVLPFLPILREDIRDPAERSAYRRHKVTHWVSLAPMHTLLAALPMLRAELPNVRCPALIMGARNDHVVPLRDAHYIFDTIASHEKQLYILDRSYHVVTRDVERHLVLAHLTTFLRHLSLT